MTPGDQISTLLVNRTDAGVIAVADTDVVLQYRAHSGVGAYVTTDTRTNN